MTDLNHVVELIHQRSGGSGVDPSDALQFLADLSALDSTAEIISRRVESDSDAVKILTIHAAKGLEFPCVIVADKWNERKATDNKDGSRSADEKSSTRPVMFLGPPDPKGKRSRLIDVSWVLEGIPSPVARLAAESEDREEMARQFYVAVTRAEHHLTLLLPGEGAEKSIARVFVNEDAFGDGTDIPVVPLPGPQPRYVAGAITSAEATQPFRGDTSQTYRRTSFSGITQTAEGRAGALHSPPGGGHDEQDVFFDFGHSYADSDVPTGAVMPMARIPGGTHTGTVIHEIFEQFDPSPDGLAGQFDGLVRKLASGPSLAPHRQSLVDGLVAAASTNLGPFMHGHSLATITAGNRLAELDFEMGLAGLDRGISVNTIGTLLAELLPVNDVLHEYASELTGPEFDIPLAGLINGSIDAVLRIDVPGAGPRLYITDYKSNRLDGEDDTTLIEAYHPARLVAPMRHHHYPLQAIIYGIAIHRFLRWRAPLLDSDEVIAGLAYFFVRGMVNDPAFMDEQGCPYGVFQWRAPKGFWAALSDALAGGAQ
jgi:exodeoxyribonuclease V beta subunit